MDYVRLDDVILFWDGATIIFWRQRYLERFIGLFMLSNGLQSRVTGDDYFSNFEEAIGGSYYGSSAVGSIRI